MIQCCHHVTPYWTVYAMTYLPFHAGDSGGLQNHAQLGGEGPIRESYRGPRGSGEGASQREAYQDPCGMGHLANMAFEHTNVNDYHAQKLPHPPTKHTHHLYVFGLGQ